MSREAAEKEVTDQLQKINSLEVDATLQAHAKLMKEFKASQQAEWDLDYEIGVWHDYELKLVGGVVEE